LDYYLSSDLMEPADGDDHYTERLVRLPYLSIYYEPPEALVQTLDRAALGLRQDATVYWSGQSLYKYLPQHDQVFARIARKVEDCQFVFIEFERAAHVTARLRERLARAFASVGLRAEDHCVFLPRLDEDRFAAALGTADVFLDSVGWSGCNSTLESLRHDLPIVTLPGGLMRGRHTMAVLQMMDVTDTIAASVDDYVAIAVRLGRDPEWRAFIKRRVAANKHRVYRDRSCIAALEEFLLRVARREPSIC
jgi:predicted O-linked N-acetylglucosamine transferase (SPINDLY family)